MGRRRPLYTLAFIPLDRRNSLYLLSPRIRQAFLVYRVRETGYTHWELLAIDFESGNPIDINRYKPSSPIPGFPDNIETYIAIWNDAFPVNFFRCRHILKGITTKLLEKINHAILFNESDIVDIRSRLIGQRFLLFFHDDDDWFAPDAYEKIATKYLCLNDIAVFPLVRLEFDSFTFVRKSETAKFVIGERRDFHFHFQTNNYGLPSRIAFSDQLFEFKDHVLASRYAEKMSLTDSYFDVIISATNKTPCCASNISRISNLQSYKTMMQDYVRNLSSLIIHSELVWIKPPLIQTIELFKSLLVGT